MEPDLDGTADAPVGADHSQDVFGSVPELPSPENGGQPGARLLLSRPFVGVGFRSRRRAGCTACRPKRSLLGNVTSTDTACLGCEALAYRSTARQTAPGARDR